jgi:hypothetical protein
MKFHLNKKKIEIYKEYQYFELNEHNVDIRFKMYINDDILFDDHLLRISFIDKSFKIQLLPFKGHTYKNYQLTSEEFKFLKSEILKKQRRCSLSKFEKIKCWLKSLYEIAIKLK